MTDLTDEPPFGLRSTETVCPSCHLVCNKGGMAWGVCSDCVAEGIRSLPF